MKKNLVLILFLSLIFLLVGCNSDKKENKSIEATNEQNNVDEKKETDLNNVSPIQSTEISPNEQAVEDKNNVSQTTTKENSKVKFLKNTAVFTGDGNKATFHGNNHTLNFTFPSLTEIKISGFKPLEGKTYLNNKIPGHECS